MLLQHLLHSLLLSVTVSAISVGSKIGSSLSPSDAATTGQPVLLYNAAFNQYLFVSNDKMGSPPENVVESHANRDDHRNLFVLQHVGNNNRYKIYNPAYNMWLFVSKDTRSRRRNHVIEAHVHSARTRVQERNQFTFESIGGNQFVMYSPSFREYLFVSRKKIGGDNIVLSQSSRDEASGRFTLVLLSELQVLDTQFYINNGSILSTDPVVLLSKRIVNRSGAVQTSKFTFKETVSETSSFQYRFGVNLTAGVKFSVKIPFLSLGRLSLGASSTFTHRHTWGVTTTISKEFSHTFTMNCPPQKVSIGQVIVDRSVLNVPYKMTLRSAEGIQFHSHGIWNGVTHWNQQFSVQDSSL